MSLIERVRRWLGLRTRQRPAMVGPGLYGPPPEPYTRRGFMHHEPPRNRNGPPMHREPSHNRMGPPMRGHHDRQAPPGNGGAMGDSRRR